MTSNASPSASASAPTADTGGSASKRAYDDVWRQIDALGGAHDRADIESGYAEAYDQALTAAIAAVETLGGEWN